ncbi:MAG: lipopolysaccharide kinase InaA family protein [Gammaproteobacteria bacterium]
MIKLSPDISMALGAKPFDTLMSLRGDVYRQQGDRETARLVIDQTSYFIKRYHRDIFIHGAKGEWEALRLCESLGVSVPALKGFGARGMQSFVLMEALVDADSIENIKPDWSEKVKMTQQIAQMAKTLHSQGYYHRDFYICHFFWNRTAEKVSLIDLHRLFKPMIMKQHHLEKDLSALLFSVLDMNLHQRDVLRFLKHYFGLPLHDIVKKHAGLLRACEKKAIALYHKAYHQKPRHVAWLMHRADWPDQVGEFHHVFHLDGKVFESDACLRVLGNRRAVLSGMMEHERVVIKFFRNRRDFQKENPPPRNTRLPPFTKGGLRHRSEYLAAPFTKGGLRNRSEYLAAPFTKGGLRHRRAKHLSLLRNTGKMGSLYYVIYAYIPGHAPTQLSAALLKTIADLHNHGLIQTDPHLDNFRISDDKIHVLDPASIESTHLEDKMLDNLAQLYAQWPRTLDKAHLTLLPVYVAARQQTWTDETESTFMKRLARARAYRLKKWLSKVCRSSSAFYAKSRSYIRIYAKRSFANVYTQTLMRFPDAYFQDNSVYLKQGRSNTVVRVTIGSHDVVIKRYNMKSLLHFLKGLVRGSKAKRAWRNTHLCLSLGIPTPEPLAMIEKRFLYIPLQSYLVTRFAPGTRLDHMDVKAITPDMCEKMAAAIKQAFDLFASVQCYHGDLKASNWIWDGETMQLIDLDSLKHISCEARFKKYHQKDKDRFLQNFDVTHPLHAMLTS